jgi:HSP20 family protein
MDLYHFTFDYRPRFLVSERPDGFVLSADVPGVKEADLDITLAAGRLTVAGKREGFGEFKRAFTLPDTVDGEQVSADLKDGVLTLVVPKKAAVQPRRIAVKAAA